MTPSTCVLCSKASCICDLSEAVIRVLTQPRLDAEFERRETDRVPFFRPVLVGSNDGEPPRFSAFTRDISAESIGLLHIMPLARGEVIVRIPSHSSAPTDLRVRIEWCQDCGEGWYMSGGRLLNVA